MNNFAALVIGPKSGGRNYQLLAQSGDVPLNTAALGMLNTLPLVLAGWADAGEPDFVARLPLGDKRFPCILLRGAFLGMAGEDTVAFANAILFASEEAAEAAGGVEAFLRVLPPPDGSTLFAEAPPAQPFALAAPSSAHDWTGLGLAWRDRVIRVPADVAPADVAASAMAALTPPEQAVRVRGWASTAALRPSGNFVPSRSFQLLVLPADRQGPGAQYLAATYTASGFAGEHIAAPRTWEVWQGFTGIADRDAELDAIVARLAWLPQSSTMAPVALLSLANINILRAMGGAPEPQLRALLRLATLRGSARDPEFAQAAQESLAEYLREVPVREAVELIAAIVMSDTAREYFQATTSDYLAAVALSADVLDCVVDKGLGNALLTRPLDLLPFIDDLAADIPARLLDEIAYLSEWTADAAVLASRLVRRIADGALGEADAHSGQFLPVGLGRCLEWNDQSPVVTNLARPSVVRLMYRMAGNLMARFAQHLLRFRAYHTANHPDQFMIALAALEWIRCIEKGPRHDPV